MNTYKIVLFGRENVQTNHKLKKGLCGEIKAKLVFHLQLYRLCNGSLKLWQNDDYLRISVIQ